MQNFLPNAMILTVCFSDTVYKVTRNIIFMKRPTLIWEMYNAKHQKPKYVFPWNRTLKARVDFKSKTGYGLRKKLRKPNPNRIAVQLNLWKLCISAKSQKQLALQLSLNFHIWHRVLPHSGNSDRLTQKSYSGLNIFMRYDQNTSFF